MIPLGLDEDLLESTAAEPHWRVWQPGQVAVVLGRSNRPEREIYLDVCRADGVPVLRRLGGGGAVVLGPGCVVISGVWRVGRTGGPAEHLARAVAVLAAALRGPGVPPLVPRGHGDLCVGQRKVLGSSGFRRRDLFFYQASLLVAFDPALAERYLRHPSREPAYRRGRPHRAFLTTLTGEGGTLGVAELVEMLRARLVSP